MKKIIIIVIISIALFGACSLMDGKLSGVITYYFNENYGDKADVGAEIYIIKTSDFDKDSAKAISNFLMYKGSCNIRKAEISLKEAKEEIDIYEEIRLIHNIDSIIDTESDEVYSKILLIRDNKNTIKILADGNGSFNTNLTFGEYYVLIVSNHRKGNNLVDYNGLIDFNTIKIKPRKETTLNAKFGIE